jgi:hypothetical protein
MGGHEEERAPLPVAIEFEELVAQRPIVLEQRQRVPEVTRIEAGRGGTHASLREYRPATPDPTGIRRITG